MTMNELETANGLSLVYRCVFLFYLTKSELNCDLTKQLLSWFSWFDTFHVGAIFMITQTFVISISVQNTELS